MEVFFPSGNACREQMTPVPGQSEEDPQRLDKKETGNNGGKGGEREGEKGGREKSLWNDQGGKTREGGVTMEDEWSRGLKQP